MVLYFKQNTTGMYVKGILYLIVDLYITLGGPACSSLTGALSGNIFFMNSFTIICKEVMYHKYSQGDTHDLSL